MNEKPNNLHQGVANAAFPNGGQLRCEICNKREAVSREQCADNLATGWPSCCGQQMKVDVVLPPASPSLEITAMSRCVEGLKLIENDKAAIKRVLDYLRSRFPPAPGKRQDGVSFRGSLSNGGDGRD